MSADVDTLPNMPTPESLITVHDDGTIYIRTTRHDAAGARRLAAELIVAAEVADAQARTAAAFEPSPVTGADPDTSPPGYRDGDQPAPVRRRFCPPAPPK